MRDQRRNRSEAKSRNLDGIVSSPPRRVVSVRGSSDGDESEKNEERKTNVDPSHDLDGLDLVRRKKKSEKVRRERREVRGAGERGLDEPCGR